MYPSGRVVLKKDPKINLFKKKGCKKNKKKKKKEKKYKLVNKNVVYLVSQR